MNPLELYLEHVARELRSMPPIKRDEELRELRSHLEQRVEDFEAQGLKPEDAQTRAGAALGSPRALGSRLCDAWEGIAFSWWRVGGAVLGVTVIWFVGTAVTAVAIGISFTQPVAALFPEVLAGLIALNVSLPFGCGALLSRWLGRRGPLAALFTFALLFLPKGGLHFDTTRLDYSGIAFPDAFIAWANSPWTTLFNIASGLAGAWLLSHLQTRARLRLAAVGGATFGSSATRVQLNHKWLWRLGVCFFVVTSCYARVRLTLHPTTPAATLRYSLLTDYAMNTGDFESPTILGLRELPARTPAERTGRERRIWFQVEMRATRGYAARRVTFLKDLLASPKDRKTYGEKPLRLSLERAQRNRRTIQGVARLIKTPNGWQVDRNSFSSNRLGAWLYDLYYER